MPPYTHMFVLVVVVGSMVCQCWAESDEEFVNKRGSASGRQMVRFGKRGVTGDARSMVRFGKRAAAGSRSMVRFGKRASATNRNMVRFGRSSGPAENYLAGYDW